MDYNFDIISDTGDIRLDRYLTGVFPHISRSKIQMLIRSGSLLVNDKTVKSGFLLKGGERITCTYIQPEMDEIIPEPMDLDILHEDEHIIVINKPAGLVVHPGSGNWSGTLVHGLKYHFHQLSMSDTIRPGIVHRLDKDTTGVIVIAKNDEAHQKLGTQFSDRKVEKKYVALVWGQVSEKGKVEGLIGRHPVNRQAFAIVKSSGRQSLTGYELEFHVPPLSWVRLYPHTGRTHQIRVHMSHIGHPVFGDELYGGGLKRIRSFHTKYTRLLKSLFNISNRTMLHAASIRLTHPATGELCEWTAPIPQDIRQILNLLKDE